ncbi:MAG TPA: multiheme c-type cytochrome [Anaeromyxobacter sp.]|nr:multiheme c-type cytochrome [Anaeromyxobacter sp.]
MRHPSLAVLLAVLAPSSPHAGDKVGPEACKACHPSAYEAWRASPHARAREALPERSRDEARCLSCHAPDAEDGLAGVSCEACHGGGRLYAAPYVMRDDELARALGLVDPGEKTCLACHTESTPSLVKFEYERKVALIEHGKEPPPPPPPPPPRKPASPRKGP